MEEIDVKFSLDDNCNLKIELSNHVKLQVESDVRKIFETYENMMKWFADPQVPEAEKSKYMRQKINLFRSFGKMMFFLEDARYTSAEIDEILKLPF
jgi:hypothetical protein